MRLLHVVPTYIPAWRYGGPIYSVHGLCKALVRRGHEVTVATTNVDGSADSEVPLGREVPIDGVQVRYFPSRFLRRLYFSAPMHRWLRGAVESFDLVHTHSVFLWPPWVAGKLAVASGVAHVISPRGMLVAELISRRSTLLKRLWIRLVEKRRFATASAVHVTSAIEQAELIRLGLHPKRIFIIPNGIDPSGDTLPQGEQSRDDRQLPASGYVLFLGRINWKKGLDRLIDALVDAPAARLVVAGIDEANGWAEIERRAAALHVAERVTYLGQVLGARKQALLRNASMLVLPSYSENFGNVVLEAMASTVPVIVTREVGAAELVDESHSGLVVEGSAPGIAAAIRSLLDDASLRRTLAENGRNAAGGFSWNAIAERMEARYLELISMRGRR